MKVERSYVESEDGRFDDYHSFMAFYSGEGGKSDLAFAIIIPNSEILAEINDFIKNR